MNRHQLCLAIGASVTVLLSLQSEGLAQIRYFNNFSTAPSVRYGVVQTPTATAVVGSVRQFGGRSTTTVITVTPRPYSTPPSIQYGARPSLGYGWPGTTPRPTQYPYSGVYQQNIPSSYATLYMNGGTHHYCHQLPRDCRPVTYGASNYYLHNNIYYRPYFYRGATVYVVVPRPF